jgi:hypothetical protein
MTGRSEARRSEPHGSEPRGMAAAAHAAAAPSPTLVAAVAAAWDGFWFAAADARPLAVVRIGTAAIALVLWWSFAADAGAWLGPTGLLPPAVVRGWRSPAAVSLFDVATTPAAARILLGLVGATLVALLVGAGTVVVAPAAAVAWATLMNRVPMLAGPADDVVAVLLWCLAVGPCGDHVSFDRWWADRRPPGGPATPPTSWRAGLSLGLLQAHASAIAAAAAVSQLKGDAWWNGLAAWYLASSPRSGLAGIAPALASWAYLGDLVTHTIILFELALAVGVWFAPARRPLARLAVVAWPLVGLLAGEPWWGAGLAVMAVPMALSMKPSSAAVRLGHGGSARPAA